jgi:glycosyltransferase involved in cell wall biosynthesis
VISVLIPTFNADVSPLVDFLLSQNDSSSFKMEIIIWDDASNIDIFGLCDNENISFFRSPVNMGRSKTRELLAEKAKYPYLLFLDADVLPVSTLFIAQYLQHASEKAVLVGGIRYESEKPESNRYFRWFYGKAREEISVKNRLLKPYDHFMTGNFLVPKSIFLKFPLHDVITGYGHEDTLLGYKFQQVGVPIRHIDNPVFHLGLEENEVFFAKSKEAVSSLLRLKQLGYTVPSKLISGYNLLEKLNLVASCAVFYPVFESRFIKNYIFSGNIFSLFFFDLSRLLYFCTLSLKRGK